MSLLEVENVSVRRGGADVLSDVTLRVDVGEVVALLGSNGVGKSTVLRTISGLHKPHRGRIAFAETTISGIRPEKIVRAGIAHVPEGRQIFAGLSVRENLEIAAAIRGRLTEAALREIEEIFPVMPDLYERRAGVLSGGQQQMLAIARGILARPRLMLLDEPSLGLAPKVVSDIGAIVRRLPEMGIAVLLVEQNATLALDVSSRGYLMAGGRVVLDGAADVLRESEDVQAVYLGRRRD